MVVFSSIITVGLLLQTAQETLPAERDIVVTARGLDQTEKALTDCVTRQCPVEEDVAATLAHTENQFVAGDYEAARRTLSNAMRRNGRHARDYPVAVASLSRTRSRVSAHLGDGGSEMSYALDTVSNLRAGLASNDARVIVARTELGDAYVRRGAIVEAERIYRRAAREAADAGHPLVEGFAKLRLANMFLAAAEKNQSYRNTARKAIDEIVNSPVPEHAAFARAARVLEARIAAKRGDTATVDTLIDTLTARPGALEPVLVHAPEIELGERANDTDTGGGMGRRMALTDADFRDQWIDVGFSVTSDGRVSDVEILRQSPGNTKHWNVPVLDAVAARRYAPLDLPATDPGVFRIERLTYTSRWTQTTGTRLSVREVRPRIERLDLSSD